MTMATGIDTRYRLVVSSDREHRLAAQRLRHAVFSAEPGFAMHGDTDADRFDEFCDHLLVRDESTGRYVGCYRMLPPDAAVAAGGYYTETEFDLTEFASLRPRLVEMGRACVDRDHRNGAVLPLMWAGVLRYLRLTGHVWLIGCVSVPMGGEGENVRAVRDVLRDRHAGPVVARPHRPVPGLETLPAPDRAVLPPLLRGYLRLGATICGDPAHDPDFEVADFVALLGLHEADERYLDRLTAAANRMAS